MATLSGCPGSVEQASDWELEQADDTWWMATVNVGQQRWLVGGSPAQGRVLFDSGGGLAEVDLGVEVELLNWVHPFDDGGVVIVGNGGMILYSPDGSSWTRQSGGITEQNLWGVWGSSAQDVWVVGGDGFAPGDATILRGPVGDLEPVDVPALEHPSISAWYKVWGSGPDDVYIVGQDGGLLQWDGVTLTEQLVGLSRDLIGVWGTGPDRVVVVGGRLNGAMALWDGSEWRGFELAPLTGLNGVWLRGNTIHAVGGWATSVKLDFNTGEVLGEQEVLGLEIPESQGVDLHTIHGSDDGRLTAVGGNFMFSSGPYDGLVITRHLGSEE
jgi:hypothetical protein